MPEPSDSYLSALRAFELKRAREAASEAGAAAAVEPEKSSESPGMKISPGPVNANPRKPLKPLPHPPSKVGGTASASSPSRDSVTGAINYNFPADFPVSSRDRVKAEEISAAIEINEKIKAARSDWELPALRISCVMRAARAFLSEAIQLDWGAHRIDLEIRAFFLSAQVWAGLATDSGYVRPEARTKLDDALLALLHDARLAPVVAAEHLKPGQADKVLPKAEDSVSVQAATLLPFENGTDRRKAVDAFLVRCNQEPALSARVIRKHIWLAVGHKFPRQFQSWQAGSDKATNTDGRNFSRILQMSPADFVALLKNKRIISAC